ncbi:MAG: TrbC/VirB2 family protein [Wolbachia sp.]
MTRIKEIFLFTLFVILIFFNILDAQADETVEVICNVVSYIHEIGGALFTVVIIWSSLLAIFGRMPWPALFALGMFIAIFFGASKIVTAITGEGACCLEGQIMKNGKCVNNSGGGGTTGKLSFPSGFTRNNVGRCVMNSNFI